MSTEGAGEGQRGVNTMVFDAVMRSRKGSRATTSCLCQGTVSALASCIDSVSTPMTPARPQRRSGITESGSTQPAVAPACWVLGRRVEGGGARRAEGRAAACYRHTPHACARSICGMRAISIGRQYTIYNIQAISGVTYGHMVITFWKVVSQRRRK